MKKEYVTKEQLDAHRKLVNLAWSLGTSLHRLDRLQTIMSPAYGYLNDEEYDQDEFVVKSFLEYLKEEISIVKKIKRDLDAAITEIGLNDEQNRNS